MFSHKTIKMFQESCNQISIVGELQLLVKPVSLGVIVNQVQG